MSGSRARSFGRSGRHLDNRLFHLRGPLCCELQQTRGKSRNCLVDRQRLSLGLSSYLLARSIDRRSTMESQRGRAVQRPQANQFLSIDIMFIDVNSALIFLEKRLIWHDWHLAVIRLLAHVFSKSVKPPRPRSFPLHYYYCRRLFFLWSRGPTRIGSHEVISSRCRSPYASCFNRSIDQHLFFFGA